MEIQNLITDTFYSLVLITFIIRTINNSLYHSFYWQLKEYRLDRYLAYLRTPLGKKMLLSPISLFKWTLIVAFILTFILLLFVSGSNLFIYFNIMRLLFFVYWFSIILEGIINIFQLIRRKWLAPKITLKISIILFAVLFIQLTPVLGSDWSFLFIIPVLDKSLSISIFLIILITNVPTYIYKKIVIYIAGKKIRKFKNLKVIGITGSFGKTSTKEFLACLLGSKYKVAKTSGSINTDIGTAKYILNEVDKSHDVFVVEMGAYKKGEIVDICKIVDPEIGIVTGINQQHIELFGSIGNIIEAKFELIKNLKKNGIAVFNFGNPYTKKMIDWCKIQRPDLKLWVYQRLLEKDDLKALRIKGWNVLVAYAVSVGPTDITFKLQYRDKVVGCQAKLAGSQNIDNILAASCVALELGFKIEEIKKNIKSIQSPDKTMKLLPKKGKLVLVDDTFNTNPDGVIAALEYIKVYKGVKILILTPLIELGSYSEKVHTFLGKYAASVCDWIFLTNPNYMSSIISGANMIDGDNKVQLIDHVILKDTINRLAEKEGVVVFEGKEAARIIEQFHR